MTSPTLLTTISFNTSLITTNATSLLHSIAILPHWPNHTRHTKALIPTIRYIYHRHKLLHSESMHDLHILLQTYCNGILQTQIQKILALHPRPSVLRKLELGTQEYANLIAKILEQWNSAVEQACLQPKRASRHLGRLPLVRWVEDLKWYQRKLRKMETELVRKEWQMLEKRQREYVERMQKERNIGMEVQYVWRLKRVSRISQVERVKRRRTIWRERMRRKGRRSVLFLWTP